MRLIREIKAYQSFRALKKYHNSSSQLSKIYLPNYQSFDTFPSINAKDALLTTFRLFQKAGLRYYCEQERSSYCSKKNTGENLKNNYH